MDEIISSTGGIAFKSMQVWGSFAMVVFILCGVIWWLLYTNRVQRTNYQQVIEDLNSERKEWQSTAFTLMRETQEKLFNSIQVLKDIAELIRDQK